MAELTEKEIIHLKAYYNGMSVLISALIAGFLIMVLNPPDLNLMVAVSSVLPIGIIHNEPRTWDRLYRMSKVVFFSAVLQFVITMLIYDKFLLLSIAPLLTFCYLILIPRSTVAIIVVTIGWMAISSRPGLEPALNRSWGLLISFVSALIATEISRHFEDKVIEFKQSPHYHITPFMALRMTMVITLCAYIYKFWQLPQGNWLVLTACLLYMSYLPEFNLKVLVVHRIIGAPIGLVLAFLLLASSSFFSYKIYYLLPFMAAVVFYAYNRTKKYVIFTAGYLMVMALFSDLAVSTYVPENLPDVYILRIFCTTVAAIIVLFFNIYFLPGKEGYYVENP